MRYASMFAGLVIGFAAGATTVLAAIEAYVQIARRRLLKAARRELEARK